MKSGDGVGRGMFLLEGDGRVGGWKEGGGSGAMSLVTLLKQYLTLFSEINEGFLRNHRKVT